MTTPTITEFLLARIAEDEENAGRYVGLFPDGDMAPLFRRALAECEAKRRIVELHLGTHECVGAGPGGWDGVADERTPCPTLLALASVHADHQHYRDVWRV